LSHLSSSFRFLTYSYMPALFSKFKTKKLKVTEI